MSVTDKHAAPARMGQQHRRLALVVASVAVLIVAGLVALALRSHGIHQRKAQGLERDLMTYLPRVPGVRVIPETLRHRVTGQEGGSSDCEADATVDVQTRLAADALDRLLNTTTPMLATVSEVRPGVLRVQNYTPLGSTTLDWDC